MWMEQQNKLFNEFTIWRARKEIDEINEIHFRQMSGPHTELDGEKNTHTHK